MARILTGDGAKDRAGSWDSPKLDLGFKTVMVQNHSRKTEKWPKIDS